MAKKILFLILFSLAALLFAPKLQAVQAAYLKLDPAAINSAVGQIFEVKVNAVLGEEQAVGTDAIILYDKNLLQAQEVKYGTFFPTVSANTALEGKVLISAVTDSFSNPKTGEGTIGTIVFQTKKEGTANLTFDCTQGSTTDSNIAKNDDNFTDSIQCTANINSAVTITASLQTQPTATPSSTTPTPTVTVVPISTPTSVPTLAPTYPTATPSQLPRAGSTDQTFHFLILGLSLISAGVVFKSALVYLH